MKLTGEVISVQECTGWGSRRVLVEARGFSFKVPYHLAQSYYVGREIEIEIMPK